MPTPARVLDSTAIPPSAQYRFWGHVDRSSGELGCWRWTASHNAGGYSQFMLQVNGHRRLVLGHRLAYALANDAVLSAENAETLDHLCRNRGCVNPVHLEPVTNAENVRRGISAASVNARKTHCHRGHEFTPENTLTRPGRTVRECRVCALESQRRRRLGLRRDRVIQAVRA